MRVALRAVAVRSRDQGGEAWSEWASRGCVPNGAASSVLSPFRGRWHPAVHVRTHWRPPSFLEPGGSRAPPA